jgi:arylsulfatase A-like enzyme
MPGLEIGLRASIFYACALGIGAIAAGFIGARHKSTGYGVALLVWTLGIGGPAFSMAQADTRATATKNIGPNILLLTADTMRADYMSVYNGVAPTPALEALAEGGAKFEQAYSLAPWTIPSLSGLFSSKYPPGISPHLSDEESEDELTLYGEIPKYWLGETSESIVKSQRTRGYRTGVAMGNYGMIQQDWPLGQFEERVTLPFWPMMYLGPFSESAFLSDFLRSMAPSLYERRPGDTTRAIAELAHRFIRYQHGEQFFFWAHFLDPHSPYHPPNGFRTQEGPFAAYPFINKKSDGLERDYIRSLYANEISYVDSAMGKVLSLLGELNMDDQTYTVMTSDHGEELWDRGRIGHGQTLFDEQLHVPLIIKGPGVTAQTIKGSVSAIDIIPTIAVWTDTPHDPEWRGKSLARSLEGKRARQVNRVVFAQATGLLPKPVEPLQAVIIGNHKLVRGVESGKTQLFGRARDPGETKDISKRNPAVVRQLKRELRRWTESFPETFEQFRNEDEAPEPDAEMLEYLRALGYLPSEAP